MGTIKIAILEKDGVELVYQEEMDLIAALNYVGALVGSGGFDEDDILVDDNYQILVDDNYNVLRRD